MIRHSLPLTIAWGDCDPFGLVYYPAMFTWFNEVEHDLLRRIGFGTRRLIEDHQTAFVMGEVQLRFTGPASYGAEIISEIRLAKIGGASVDWAVRAFHKDTEAPICEGLFTRIHARTLPDGGLKAQPIPEEIRQAFQKDSP